MDFAKNFAAPVITLEQEHTDKSPTTMTVDVQDVQELPSELQKDTNINIDIDVRMLSLTTS